MQTIRAYFASYTNLVKSMSSSKSLKKSHLGRSQAVRHLSSAHFSGAANGWCSTEAGHKTTELRTREVKGKVKKFGAVFFLLVPLLVLPTVHATQIVSGSGPFSTTVTSAVTSLVDGIAIVHETFTLSLTGFLVGTTLGTALVVIDLSTGSGVFHGMQTFTGTANGVAGSFQMSFSAEINGFTAFKGQFTILTGNGGLSNLHGQGTIAGIVNVSGTYSGTFIFT